MTINLSKKWDSCESSVNVMLGPDGFAGEFYQMYEERSYTKFSRKQNKMEHFKTHNYYYRDTKMRQNITR